MCKIKSLTPQKAKNIPKLVKIARSLTKEPDWTLNEEIRIGERNYGNVNCKYVYVKNPRMKALNCMALSRLFHL